MQLQSTTDRTARDGNLSSERVVLEPYFREMEAESLMSPAQEYEAGRRVVAANEGYWRALVYWAPVRRAVVAAVRETGAQKRVAAIDWSTITSLMSRRGWDDATTAFVVAQCRSVDPGCDVADMLYADVQALAGGAVAGTMIRLRKSQRDGSAFTAFVNGVRKARIALHAARAEFARANLRLVVTMAHRYRRSGRLALADLVQEGNLGLMTAIDRFDPERGFRFSTYASWWIRHAIRRAIADRGRDVRVPLHVLEMRSRISKARRTFEQEAGRTPTDQELSTICEVPLDKIEGLSRVLLEPSEPRVDASSADGVGLVELLPAEEIPVLGRIEAAELSGALERALDVLRPMEAEILRLRFGLDDTQPMKLREIGAIYSLSRERIRQLQDRALGKLRDALAVDGY